MLSWILVAAAGSMSFWLLAKSGKKAESIGVDFAPQMIERAKKAVIDSGLQQWDIELKVMDMGESQLPGKLR